MSAAVLALLLVAAPERIVTLGGSITETVFALGRGGEIVAIDQTSQYPAAVLKLPNVGFLQAASAEGILAQKPTLVVALEEVGPPEAIAALSAANIRVERLPTEKSIAGAKARIEKLGAILERKTEAAALIAQLDADLASVKPGPVSAKVAFIYARSAGAVQVAGKGTGAAAIIALAGGKLATPDFEAYRPLSAEGLLAASPEIILFTSRGLGMVGGIEGALAIPGVSDTPAGRNRRVVAIDDNLLLSFGPRTGQAVKLLARELAKGAPQ